MLILDSGAVSRLSGRTKTALSLMGALSREGLWPPTVPTVVLVESLLGDPGRDANTHRLLKTCLVETTVSERTARRAAALRRLARRGSAVDALVASMAEPGGTVLTGDREDIEALAARADGVTVHVI